VNAERLHVIALALKSDFTSSKLLQSFAKLNSELQNVINSPGQPQYQTEVSEARARISKVLQRSPTNSFSPTWKQVLAEIGASELVGIELDERIAEIFSRNQITASVALQELQALEGQLQSLVTALDQLLGAYRQLEIGAEELEPGECEVGVLIPRSFVSNRLEKFSDELEKLDKIFGVFSELAEGSRPGFTIRTISSSDLSIFLEAAPATCACIAVAVERIVALYKSLLEIRKLRSELAQHGVSVAELKGIQTHADGVMEKGIEEFAKKMIDEREPKLNKERSHELFLELKLSLKKIAKRIDFGFNFEVRMAPMEADETAPEPDPAAIKAAEHYAKIQEATSTLQFLRLDGDPILKLSEDPKANGEPKKVEPKKEEPNK
jgi:hypothetical protein